MAAAHHDNLALLARVRDGDEAAVETLMENNAGLVVAIAKRFLGRGCEAEDLVQIGNIGMLKAIRSFDLSRGVTFSTYATPLIIGEIRRYLRDDGIIKIGRDKKRLGMILVREKERFAAEYGREAHLSELAEICGCTDEEALDALNAVSQVRSLSEPTSDDGELTLESTIAVGGDAIDAKIERLALAESIRRLPPLWRKIIVLRYFCDRSQQATAERLGLTQVKISREEKKIMAQLRRELGE